MRYQRFATVFAGLLLAACAEPGATDSECAGACAPAQSTAALSSTGISSEVLLDSPVVFPRDTDQNVYEIAADPSGFLVTWFDGRESSGIDSFVGAQPHIYAARVSNSGMVETPTGLALSRGDPVWGQSHVRSAFNGQNYLVAWHKLTRSPTVAYGPDWTLPSAIEARRVSQAGELVDAAPFVISVLPAGDQSAVDIVLSNGNGFFVAWVGKTSATVGPVQSRTVSFVDSAPVLGPVTTYPFPASDHSKYAFASGGLGYVVASVNSDSTGFTVGGLSHAATSDCATGARIDSVALGSNGSGELLVAYTGFVMTNGSVCSFATKALQIGADGLQKAPAVVIRPFEVPVKPVEVNYINGKYLVAGFQLDPATNTVSPSPVTTSPSKFACNAGACLAAVGAGVSRLSSAGVLLDDPPIRVNSSASAEIDPHVVAGAGEYLAVWHDIRALPDNPYLPLHAGRLDANGAPLDATPIAIAPHGYFCNAEFDGTDFLVRWTGLGILSQTRISPAGVVKDSGPAPAGPQGPCGPTGNGVNLGVSSIPFACGSQFVTFKPTAYSDWYRNAASLVDLNGTVLQADLNLGGVAWAGDALPGVASTAAGCVIAWSQSVGDTHDVYANFVNDDGTVVLDAPLPIATDAAFNEVAPALAEGADGKILVAYSHFINQASYGHLRIAARLVEPSAFVPGASGSGGTGGEASGVGGSVPTGGALASAGSGGDPVGGTGGWLNTAGATVGGWGEAGNVSGGAASAGGAGGSTSSGGSLAAGGTESESGGGSSPGGAVSGGSTQTDGGSMPSGNGGGAMQSIGGESGTNQSIGGESGTGESSGGSMQSSAGESSADKAGAPGGHGSDGSGCAISSHRRPLRGAPPVVSMLIALLAWRCSRRAARAKALA